MSDVNDLIRRLRGEYRIPITDGLGAAGGDEPNNQNEFVRTFDVPPVNKEAAALIEQQAARIAELEILHKGADFAAKHNWEGWQQEIGRAEALSAKVADLTLGLSSAEYEADKWATQCRLTYERAEAAERELAAVREIEKKLADLLLHAWVHSGYPNCGYEDMTYEQKKLYDTTIDKTFAQKDGGNG